METEENSVSVEKLLLVVDVIWGDSELVAGLLFPKFRDAKSEATLDIAEPELGINVGEDACPSCPFCCCCCCCIRFSSCCLFNASSIRVGTFGTGGGGEVGIPNGFFDPVCCATRGLIGSGELVFSGADAGRGGMGMLYTGLCGWGGGCDCCCCSCCGSVNGEFTFGCWLMLNGLVEFSGACCGCPGVWPKTGKGLVPWVVGEGPNGEGVDGEGPNDEEVEGESPNDEGVVGEGPNGERLNPVACGGTPPIPF